MRKLVFLALFLVSTVNAQCQYGDHFISSLCYRVINYRLTAYDADYYCMRNIPGARLAVLQTTTQANFLATYVSIETDPSVTTFWIGLSRASVSSRFYWSDGSAMYWSNFDKDSGSYNFVGEQVVNGKWTTVDGDSQLVFVCSYDPYGSTALPTSATDGTVSTSTRTTTTISSDNSTPDLYTTESSSADTEGSTSSIESSSSPVTWPWWNPTTTGDYWYGSTSQSGRAKFQKRRRFEKISQ